LFLFSQKKRKREQKQRFIFKGSASTRVTGQSVDEQLKTTLS